MGTSVFKEGKIYENLMFYCVLIYVDKSTLHMYYCVHCVIERVLIRWSDIGWSNRWSDIGWSDRVE